MFSESTDPTDLEKVATKTMQNTQTFSNRRRNMCKVNATGKTIEIGDLLVSSLFLRILNFFLVYLRFRGIFDFAR